MSNPADLRQLPRLALDRPELLDRAVTHAFWTMRALIRGLDDAEEGSDEAERARRRDVMRALATELSVCTEAPPAPRPVQRRAR